MNIKQNINLIRQKLADTAARAERNPDDIKLLGVCKKIKSEAITEAYKSGLMDFGENYAQEFRDKYGLLNQDLINARWHFIGHLQKNKIKYVVGKADLIHSVDSLALAGEIDRRSEIMGMVSNILIEEINTNNPPLNFPLHSLVHLVELSRIVRSFDPCALCASQ